MSTKIFYFTGTGNSLKIARDLVANFEDAQLVPVAKAVKQNCEISQQRVGFVFPVYAWGPPVIVRQLIKRLNLNPKAYVFAICTYAGSFGGTLDIVAKLFAKRGVKLSAGFAIKMPNNYITWGDITEKEKEKQLFEEAKAKIKQIVPILQKKEKSRIERGRLISRIGLGVIHSLFCSNVAKGDKRFSVLSSCNSCRICEKICPVGNIKIENDLPKWQHHCQQCLACLHYCPVVAIQMGKSTLSKKRYNHPDVPARDLMLG